MPLPVMLDSCSGILGSFPCRAFLPLLILSFAHVDCPLFSSDHRFLGFESRHRDGHCKTLILCSRNHLCAYLDVWLLLLSCWNVHAWPSVNLLQCSMSSVDAVWKCDVSCGWVLAWGCIVFGLWICLHCFV